MQVAQKTHKYIKPLAALTTAAIAITTTINVASAKYLPSSSPFGVKTQVLVSRIVGPNLTVQIFGSYGLSAAALPPQGIAPFGIFNTTTFAGAVTLLANYLLKEFRLPMYNTYAAPFINALGIGLFVGGVVGGLLDPPAGGSTSAGRAGYGGVAGFSFSNATAGRSVMGYTGIN